MKSDHRVLLCCVAAWLCCAAANCRQFLDVNGNALKEKDSLENDWFVKDDEFNILEDSLRRKQYNARFGSDVFRDAVTDPECIKICGNEEDVECKKDGETITCVCKEKQKKFDGKNKECKECDCGDNGDCSFDQDSKKECNCHSDFKEKNGKCEDAKCVDKCGVTADVTCKPNNEDFDCECSDEKMKFDDSKKECRKCDCGDNGDCSFDQDGKKECNCHSDFKEKNGKCEDAKCVDKCGVTAEVTCKPNNEDFDCECSDEKMKFDDSKKECRICDCGANGVCSFDQVGEKKCTCHDNFKEKNGICQDAKCVDKCGVTADVTCKPNNDDFDCECSDEKMKFDDSKKECRICECGDNADCSFDKDGTKECTCRDNFKEKNGICEDAKCVDKCGVTADVTCKPNNGDFDCECSDEKKKFDDSKKECRICECGDNADCSFDKDGKKECTCRDNFKEKNGKCEDAKCVDKCGVTADVTCKPNNGDFDCECSDEKMKFDGSKKECRICDCGANGVCSFDQNGEKKCTCHDNFKEKNGICEDQKCVDKCGVNKDVKCEANGGDFECECSDAKKKFDGSKKECRTCDCGKNGKCSFDDQGTKTCSCNEKYQEKNGICEDEKCVDTCGITKDVTCKEKDGEIECECSNKQKKFDDNKKECRSTCTDATSCKYGADCEGEDEGKKFCVCQSGTSGDTCEIIDDCATGKYKNCTGGGKGTCSYDVLTATAECTCESGKKLKEKSGYCEACDCGKNGECSFDDEDKKTCDCNENFKEKNGMCEDEKCVDTCGITKDVTCKEKDGEIECECSNKQKKFDDNKKECRSTCADATSCMYGAKCEGVSEGEKFCDCPSGTSGDTCEIIDDCATGKYKNCTGGDKGTCSYDVSTETAHCTCESGKKLKDKSGYCEDCNCGEFSLENGCKFDDDAKVCECKEGYNNKNGVCATCNCGSHSKKCSFVQNQKICECNEGYADNDGTCEECACGDNAESCKFNNKQKICTCKGKFAQKDGRCEECDCGADALSCSFENGKKTCKCKENFQDNDGTCEECNCGVNGTGCSFVKGEKKCVCKTGNAQNGDKCEVCICGKNMKKCKFEGGDKICECQDKYALKDKNCIACDCGVQGTGCKFDGDAKECYCKKGYANNNKNGKCNEDKCYTKCGIMAEEEHEDVTCVGEKFGKPEDIKCTCHNDELKFDSSLKKCREPCSDAKKCTNGAQCRKRDGSQFCDCISGTTGYLCETVTDCEEKGKYEKCKPDKGTGTCKFNTGSKKAQCECPKEKKLDEVEGYCQAECKTDKDCSHEGKICFKHPKGSYCACEQGKRGENCEIITGCTEELEEKCKKGGAVCAFSNTTATFATCACTNEFFVFNEGKKECIAKFCNDTGCKTPAECVFDDQNKTSYCECPSGRYYDYSSKTCSEPDKCLLKKTSCGLNEECVKGKCECTGKKEGDKCIKEFCKDACFKDAECDEDSGTCKCKEGSYYTGSECKELKCIENPFDEPCACPTMKRNETTKKCEPTGNKKLCEENKCGLGYCVDNNCICIPGISILHEKKCVLDKDKVCASKELTGDLSKCRCTGKYKQAKDGITCELVTCSDDAVKEECKSKGATCQMAWKGNSAGYECVCPDGYQMNEEKGICADVCSFYDNVLNCSIKKKMCYNSYSAKNKRTFECGCAPPFKSQNCNELSEYVYLISGIPVMKQRYTMQNGIDYVKLNSHMMQSLSQMYTKDVIDAGYLHNYEEEGDVLKTSVWVRFTKNSSDELRRIMRQAQSFPNGTCDDCDTSLVVWPPNVVLSGQDIKDVKVDSLSMCASALKDKLCGEDAGCENNTCFCRRGFRILEYTINDIGDGKARILRCEKTNVADLDECALGTHKCSDNTTCVKIPGSYICKCKPGYQKSTENDQRSCVDLCTPSPCGKGTCSMKKDKFNCKCQAGYGGSYCDEQDVNFAAAKKSTVVVGAVLGTILILGVLGAAYFYIKKRKNSYSEDFMPAPRQDNASEMRERRPIRGIVNTSYE